MHRGTHGPRLRVGCGWVWEVLTGRSLCLSRCSQWPSVAAAAWPLVCYMYACSCMLAAAKAAVAEAAIAAGGGQRRRRRRRRLLSSWAWARACGPASSHGTGKVLAATLVAGLAAGLAAGLTAALAAAGGHGRGGDHGVWSAICRGGLRRVVMVVVVEKCWCAPMLCDAVCCAVCVRCDGPL